MCEPGFDKRTFALDLLKLTREAESKLGDISERLEKGHEDGLCASEFLYATAINERTQEILGVMRDSALAVLASRMEPELFEELVESYNEDVKCEGERRAHRK